VKVGILLFDNVDVMDVGGPYEVFLTASRLAARRGEEAPFEVSTVGLSTDPVTAYGGLRLTPQVKVDEAADLDLLLVPGAVAIDEVTSDARLIDALRDAAGRTDVVASVCTGAFVLGELGLLTERSWTTHWEDVEELSRRIEGKGHSRVQWVDTGAVVTSGGLSMGISMALHLVDRFAGRELAERTARQLEYPWDPEAGVEASPREERSGARRSRGPGD
jgi:transcriptional regulator GlxA family with amidase domain